MPFIRIHSIAIQGLEAIPVEIEVDAAPAEEKTTFVIVGLPDSAVRESKDRVLAAIRNSGYAIGPIQCTVNLAPGDLRKEGVFYDLPIALGVLLSLRKIEQKLDMDNYFIVGELGLGGKTRPIQGALALAICAKKLGKKGVVLPQSNSNEAAAIPEVNVHGINSLKECAQFLTDPASCQPAEKLLSSEEAEQTTPLIDFQDIKGQEHVKRALEIAAAGGHNVVLSGPPGSGKSMMAKALIGIMPELTLDEALELTRIHSVAGTLPEGKGIISDRPFRSPHHTVSYAGLIGGGTSPRPGEISLAHHGILFLDELPEFSRSVLESLRQPLEDRTVTISRARGNYTYPANVLCVAAMNPCPCGFLGHPDKRCIDSEMQINRYRGKISGPVWDRIDLQIDVPPIRYEQMVGVGTGEPSRGIQKRVIRARLRQTERLGKGGSNASMSVYQLKGTVPLTSECHRVLQQAVDVMGMSARTCHRITRVARTIADLAEDDAVKPDHLMEALGYRTQLTS